MRLIDGSHGIVEVGRRGLLDVAAQNVGDDFSFGKGNLIDVA